MLNDMERANRTKSTADIWRGAILGILVPGVSALVLCGGTAAYWPYVGLFALFGPILDSLAVHLLIAGLAGCLLIWCLGLPRLATGLAILTVFSGIHIVWTYVQQVNSPGPTTAPAAHIEIAWLNVLDGNPRAPEDIVAEIAASGADVVILTEATPLREKLEVLDKTYPYRLGCRERICALVVLSRHPFLGQPELQHTSRSERQIRLQIAPEGATPLTILAAHLVKPWYAGFIEVDRWFLYDRLKRVDGPVLVVGDFNAAPWSASVRAILKETNLAFPQGVPVATWPAKAGPLGVPIDLMLVRGGANIDTPRPWAAYLGSNHRGLRAQVSWTAGP